MDALASSALGRAHFDDYGFEGACNCNFTFDSARGRVARTCRRSPPPRAPLRCGRVRRCRRARRFSSSPASTASGHRPVADKHYYMVCLDLEGRGALVVGGGSVALEKARGLLDCGARVTVVAPQVQAALLDLDVEVVR